MIWVLNDMAKILMSRDSFQYCSADDKPTVDIPHEVAFSLILINSRLEEAVERLKIANEK
jgi:hypothetical protein